MTFRNIAAGLLCILCCITAHAGGGDYAYAWPLRSDGDSAAWQVELTPEIYAALDTEDLRDIEVVNAAGAAVPVAVYRPPVALARRDLVDLPLFVLPASRANERAADEAIRLHIERGSDGKLRRVDADTDNTTRSGDGGDLVLDASDLRTPLAGLRIDWSGTADIGAQFALSASDDLQHWRALGEAAVLHLNQNGNVLERHEIAFGAAHANYLRLHRLDNGAALPNVKVAARLLDAVTPAAPVRQWLRAVFDGVDATPERTGAPASTASSSSTAYSYHLAAPLAAVALNVELGDDNSLAAGTILGKQPSDTAWLTRANFVAFRLRQGDAVASNDDFAAFPARRSSQWRIVTSTPLAHEPVLSVAYVPDRFVFLAQGGAPYLLRAGSANARRADYPVDAALAALRTKLGADWAPPLATVGARQTLAGEQALVPTPPQVHRDWRTWLLWGVLVAAAAVVGGLALSLLRKP